MLMTHVTCQMHMHMHMSMCMHMHMHMHMCMSMCMCMHTCVSPLRSVLRLGAEARPPHHAALCSCSPFMLCLLLPLTLPTPTYASYSLTLARQVLAFMLYLCTYTDSFRATRVPAMVEVQPGQRPSSARVPP
jgi:hypothetical protein